MNLVQCRLVVCFVDFFDFRGSTHGGHYHAYIRDIDGFGIWTHPVSLIDRIV